MAKHGEAYRALLLAVRDLPDDELRVLTECADRLSVGLRQYGRLDLLHDARDYLRERHEEVLDGAIYEASHAVRARLLGTADTDPCPPPAPQLDDGTRIIDCGDLVPDDRRTERGT